MKTGKTPVALIDYGMGNLRSVVRALEKSGAAVRLVSHPREISDNDCALVFPGQGAIVDCMGCLKRTEFDVVIREWIAGNRPFFGICLGLQALFERTEEGGDSAGLGVFPGVVKRFSVSPELKIPHMGWNKVVFKTDDSMTAGIHAAGEDFYFVHSYYVSGAAPEIIWCETDYGTRFTSGIRAGNCFATQFHPEKSQAAGLQLYENFVTLAGNVR